MADGDAPVTNDQASAPREQPRALGTPAAAAIAAVATVIGVLVLAWAILFVTKGRFLKGTFERTVAAMTHRDVRVRGDFQLYFAPLDLKFVAEGMMISNPGWATKPNLFAARRIDTRIAPLSLLFGRKTIRWLDLTDGAVDLEWDAAHRINTWTFSEEKGDPFEFPIIGRATVAGTTLRYRDPQLQVVADLAFRTILSTDTRINDAVRFTGTGTARATPFTLRGSLLSPNETAAMGRNKLEATAQAAHNTITVAGTLPSLADIEDVPLATTARGRNVAELIGIIGVAVPDTRAYRLSATMVKSANEYRFTQMKGRFGDSDLSGGFTVAVKEPRILMTADLKTRVLDIVDVAPFIGYNPDAVAKGGAAAAVSQPGNGQTRLLPDAPLRVEALGNFDAKVSYTVARVRAKSLPISDIALKLDLDDRLLKLSPLTFTMARGHVSADIGINARRSPVFTDYDIRLAPTPMGTLLAGWGVAESGTTGTIKARVKMTGTGNSVRDSLASSNGRIAVILPRGTFWARNIQLSELDIGTFIQKMFEKKLKEPVQINCGLIGFTVRNGIASADPILIDTQKNVMLGRGGFSFRTEALDLAFRADSKKFSVFAGQSPVGINGSFAQPGFSVISKELLGRAGVGLGLALAATPVAGVLAFVDVGDAKSTACGPVLAGASAAQQRTTSGEKRDDVGIGSTSKSEDGKRSGGEKKDQRKKFLGIF